MCLVITTDFIPTAPFSVYDTSPPYPSDDITDISSYTTIFDIPVSPTLPSPGVSDSYGFPSSETSAGGAVRVAEPLTLAAGAAPIATSESYGLPNAPPLSLPRYIDVSNNIDIIKRLKEANADLDTYRVYRVKY